MQKNYYYCDGSVRGACGHKHRTIVGAAKCCERDTKGCLKVGGYSDRWLRKVKEGEKVNISEEENKEFYELTSGGI